MYRVKETHAEAQLLEAASSAAHAMKNHKPVRATVTLEVVPLDEGRVMEVTTENAPALRAFAPRDFDAAPNNWWEEKLSRETLTRDLYVYVDAISFGRRRDTRVRVQLRHDDLDIDGPGARAVVVSEGGGASRAKRFGASDGGASSDGRSLS